MFTFTFLFLSVHGKCPLFVVFRSQEENTHFSVVVNSNKKTHFLLLVVNSQEMLSPIQDVIHFFGSTDPFTLAGPKFRKCSGRDFRSRKCSDQFTFWAPAQIPQLVPCSAKKVRVWLTGWSPWDCSARFALFPHISYLWKSFCQFTIISLKMSEWG